MSRKARIDAPGTLHHVIVRAIEPRKVIRSDYDRDNFVNRLCKLIFKTPTDCFAWALMSNHIHLLLRTGLVPVGCSMNRLLSGYAGWFNLNICQTAVSRLSRRGETIARELEVELIEQNKKALKHRMSPLKPPGGHDLYGHSLQPVWQGRGQVTVTVP